MIDPVEIINRFTEYNPSKGELPLPLPIPGHWFRKICALADRIARAENELAALRAANRWIPCAEQMPDECQTVQFIFDPSFGNHEFAHGHIESGVWYIVADGRKRKLNNSVYCWRYLPNALYSDGPLPQKEPKVKND